jgi:ubiquinone biosynthesis protein
MAREGVFALVDAEGLPAPARLGLRLVRLVERRKSGDATARLSAALTRLGPTYVKLGQFLATRPDIVGSVIARDLESLQDRMAPFPMAQARATIETHLGQPADAIFAQIGEPVAAASVAQVHRATLAADGGTVAIKVVRPGVADRFRSDLTSMRFAAELAMAMSAEARRLKFTDVVETLRRSVVLEMDFRLEAAALSEMAQNTAADPGFRVPKVDWERTGRGVLTLEWIEGTKLTDVEAVRAAGHDMAALGRNVIQSFLRHALRDGFFHADMHPGNLFVDADSNLVAVDFGIMGRIGPKERRFLAEILLGFITRDYRKVAEVHFEAGYVPGWHSVDDFAQAIRAIGEPIHSRRADEISMAKLLTLLFEITGLFDMATRTELIMLQKTMVVVEGVARKLDPQLNMWVTAEPVVREWIARNLGPVGRLEQAASGAGEIGRFVTEVPALLSKAAMLAERADGLTRNGFVLAPETLAGIGRAEARRNRWSTAALWVIAALLTLILLKI